MNDNLTISITAQSAIAVGDKILRRDTGRLSQKTRDLITERQSMKASNPMDRIELAKLSKLINRYKIADIREYNMERTKHALKNGGSLKR